MAWVTVVFLFVLYMINYLDKSIAGYSATQIIQEMTLSPTQWGVVGSSFFWLFAIAGVIGAGVSDRIGTKKMLTILAICWTVIQAGSLVITSLPILIMARVLLGIGEGPTWPVIVSHISKWFPAERRGFIFALLTLGASIGSSLFTPALVSSIEHWGWRWAWAALGAVSLVWVMFWLVGGKDRPDGKGVSESHVSPKSHFAQLATSQSVSKSSALHWSDVRHILLSADFLFSFLLYFAQMWGVTFVLVWLPTYLVKVMKLSSIQMSTSIAMIGTIAGLITLLACMLADRLFQRTKLVRQSYVAVGGIAVLTGGILFSLVPLFQSTSILLCLFCLGIGLTTTAGSLASVIGSTLLPERTGLIMGVMSGLVTLAGMISPLVTGAIVQAAGANLTNGFHQVVLLNAFIYVTSSWLFLLNVKRKEQVKLSHTADWEGK
ncbi:MFS transporter [Brevibacillus sp. JB24b]|uniref:MFS transporter n=1 Tax=Brevibacillus sp. JB24b TaxID=3422308 RepID=UPI003F68946B